MNAQVPISAATNTRFLRVNENARYAFFRNVGANVVNVTFDGSAASATLGEPFYPGEGREFEGEDLVCLAGSLNAYSAAGTTLSVGTNDNLSTPN